ncbi:MAG: DUF4340 domain-containing protein [Lachnospiraceae bacterium]|jgi:hypothetical protein|nr:DUF4340 domain-containing protein [Lachnospiraceae bacterium]
MRHLKRLLICEAIIIAVLLASFVLLGMSSIGKPATGESLAFSDRPPTDVRTVRVDNASGGFEILFFDGGYAVTDVPVELTDVDTLVNFLINCGELTALRRVDADADTGTGAGIRTNPSAGAGAGANTGMGVDPLARFGLNPPASTVHIEYQDSASLDLSIGNLEPVTGGYYFTVAGKQGVYLIGGEAGAMFLQSAQGFISFTLIPAPQAGTILSAVRDITFTGGPLSSPVTIESVAAGDETVKMLARSFGSASHIVRGPTPPDEATVSADTNDDGMPGTGTSGTGTSESGSGNANTANAATDGEGMHGTGTSGTGTSESGSGNANTANASTDGEGMSGTGAIGGIYELDQTYGIEMLQPLGGLRAQAILRYGLSSDEEEELFGEPWMRVEFDYRPGIAPSASGTGASDTGIEHIDLRLVEAGEDGKAFFANVKGSGLVSLIARPAFADIVYEKLLLRRFLSPLLMDVRALRIETTGMAQDYAIDATDPKNPIITRDGAPVDTAAFRRLFSLAVSASGDGVYLGVMTLPVPSGAKGMATASETPAAGLPPAGAGSAPKGTTTTSETPPPPVPVPSQGNVSQQKDAPQTDTWPPTDGSAMDTEVTAAPLLRLTYSYTGGKPDDVMELYPGGPRRTLVFVNGICEFAMKDTFAERMAQAMEAMETGADFGTEW